MNSITQYSSILLTPLVCYLLVTFLSRFAQYVGMVDRPTNRKSHTGLIPTVGGLSIYVSVLVSSVIFSFSVVEILPFYIGSALVLLGALDDRFDLSARLRLPFQLLIAYAMIHFCGLQISSVGNILGFGAVGLDGVSSVIFTLMCTVGVINSINMIDGLDGLAGSLLVVTLVPLTVLAGIYENSGLVLLLLNLIVGILVFLYFNSRLFRKRASVFLGDAGSMFMGLVLVWCFIDLSQGGEPALSPVAAGWLFGLPLADTVSVMVRRVVNGKSPFAADRTHLHHRFLDAGLTVNSTVMFMVLLHLCFVLIGLVGNFYRGIEPFLFLSFVALVICHFFLADRVIKLLASRFNQRFRAVL